jgi:protein SCO1/2
MISPKGKVTRYLYGITFLPFDVKMAIVESQKGLVRPTSTKLLDYCFAYDAKSRSYTLQFTQIIGALILIVGLFFVAGLLITSRRKSTIANKD